MKRFIYVFLSLLVLSTSAFSLFSMLGAASPNLVSNHSMEAADSGNPDAPEDWHASSWGSLDTSFSYPSDGVDGDKSVRVDVSNYQSGDAKWYFEPVPVQRDLEYVYSTYYKASASTEIVMRLEEASGIVSYQWLKTVPANTSSEWQQITANYTPHKGVISATAFHVLNGDGWLQMDNVYFGLVEDVTVPPPAGDNIIPNQSMEAPDPQGQKPAFWTSDKWGNNSAIFTYANDGYDGSRSLKTEVTDHVDGDAKWFFDPVSVEGGQAYTFKEFYNSDVSTELVLMFIDADGNRSYRWIQSVAPSSNWRELSIDFDTPQNASKMTVLHVVNHVGTLQIDDTRLTKQLSTENPVPNASLENAAGAQPALWSHSSWGTNNASFEYVGEGHTGDKSVKVTMSNHQSGDAKWFFEPINTLEPGQRYRFDAWYKTNTTPKVIAMFNKTDGSTQYVGLPNPLPNGDSTTQWQLYSDTFTMPPNTTSMSMLFLVDNNGWLQTDDYSISPYQPAGFNRPLVTLTFDDGQEDNVDTALPVMNSHGFKSTQCFATDHIDGNQDQIDRVLQFHASDHEICSHTVNHPFLTSLGSTDLDHELRHSKEFLEGVIGGPVRNFASPYGDYNAPVNNVIDGYYRSHRTVDEGYNSKDNFNIYRLRVQNILDTTTTAELQSWLDYAAATNTWLILVYHRVADNPGPYDTHTNDFEAQMSLLGSSGLTVKTYNDALDEVTTQL